MSESAERQQAFLELFEPVQPKLERFVRSMTRDREVARDVMAETLLVAFEGFEGLRSEKAFLSYLFTIALRTMRRERQRRNRVIQAPEGMVDELVAGGTPADIAVDIDHLHAALARLPENEREAVTLFELSGLTMKEIAKVQEVSTAAAKMRVSRGRQRLKSLMTESDATDASAPRGRTDVTTRQPRSIGTVL